MKWVNRFAGFLLSIGISIIPVYVFDSGGIQPAHLILALFIVIATLVNGIALEIPIILVGVLAAYAFVVEYFYLLQTNVDEHILNAVYLLYSFLLTSAVYGYCLKAGFKALLIGVVGAIIITITTVVLTGVDLKELADSGRETGTFNNPNQLGYFSVCVLSISYILYRSGYMGFILASSCFVAALFISIVSLSKAAIIANMSVIMFAMLPQKNTAKVVLWSILSAVVIGVIGNMILEGKLNDYLFVRRVLGMFDENDSTLDARGYFAFLEGSDLQMLFGMGAEEVDRIVGHEVHSTIGGILNNYGIIGFIISLVLFSVWAYRVYISAGWVATLCIVAPPMLYGITHNGIRFSMFWIMVAVSMAWAKRGEAVRGHQIQIRDGCQGEGRRRFETRRRVGVPWLVKERRKEVVMGQRVI